MMTGNAPLPECDSHKLRSASTMTIFVKFDFLRDGTRKRTVAKSRKCSHSPSRQRCLKTAVDRPKDIASLHRLLAFRKEIFVQPLELHRPTHPDPHVMFDHQIRELRAVD